MVRASQWEQGLLLGLHAASLGFVAAVQKGLGTATTASGNDGREEVKVNAGEGGDGDEDKDDNDGDKDGDSPARVQRRAQRQWKNKFITGSLVVVSRLC